MKLSWLLVAVWACTAATSQAQRVIFPTMVPDPVTAYTPPASTSLAPSTSVAQWTSAAPSASLNGTIQPSLPAWDPYASGATPPPVVPPPASPYAPSPYVASPYDNGACAPQGGYFPQAIRLLQDVRLENTSLPRQIGNNGFGIQDVVLNASFAIPTRFNPAPILITPGFNFHFLNGPDSSTGLDNDLPARVYDAYLAGSWRPQFTPRVGADLAVSWGVYSDFQQVNWDSVRVLGRALGVFTINPRWKLVGGIVYLDRLSVKLLPAGGLIWTPNPDVKFDMVFPYPKLAERLTTYGNTEIWGYIAAEYGGGQWSVVHQNGQEDVVNYNDIRVMLGVEMLGPRIRGNAEIGYVFDREILYRYTGNDYKPGDTMMFRSVFAF